MRVVFALYYLLYILAGGFRHFSVDYIFWGNLYNGTNPDVPLIIRILEIGLITYAFFHLFFDLKKYHHLFFGLILFVGDIFFQNKVSYVSSLILPHIMPFFFFSYLNINNIESKKLLAYFSMLLISAGYLTAFYAKFSTNWYEWNSLVLYNYIHEFNSFFKIPTLLGDSFLDINSHLFWKFMDWSVLIYQLSFILVFINRSFFHILSLLSILFHLGILFTLGIGVFYMYIVFYSFIYYSYYNSEKSLNKESFELDVLFKFLALVLCTLYVYSGFKPQFFNYFLSSTLYVFIEYFYNALALLIFAPIYIKTICLDNN